MQKILFSLLFILSVCVAKETHFDRIHSLISDKVEKISTLGDELLYNSFSSLSKAKEQQDIDESKSVDALFQNRKYTDETKKSYVRFSTDYKYNSKDDDELHVRLNASLALNKSNERLHFFFKNFRSHNSFDTLSKKAEDETPEIGLSYIDNFKKDLQVRYYLGIHNINPFVRARFSYKHETENWTIEPVQTLEYSIKDEFEEVTNIYIDKPFSDELLLRINASRATQSEVKGMTYGGAVSLYWRPNFETGVQLSQSIYANTKYSYIDTNTNLESSKNGVYNHETKLTLRQNIFRKWFFYELSPAVNFHHEHDFAPNYSFYVRCDIFFGKGY